MDALHSYRDPAADPVTPLRLTLVRHGETTGQSSIRYFGRTDLPLSELGVLQMRRTGHALRAEEFDAIFSSCLRRSRDGAALVAGSNEPMSPIAGFDEVDFGRWEGWTRQEIEHRDPENFRRWRKNPSSFTYPDGEARQAFETRVAGALENLLAALTAENVLMVLHRGVIAVILTRVLALDADQRASLGIDLGSIHVVGRRDTEWVAEHLNRTDHLRDDDEETHR